MHAFVRQHPQRCGNVELTRAAQCRGSRPQKHCGSTCWVASRCGSRNGVEWGEQLQLRGAAAGRAGARPRLSDRDAVQTVQVRPPLTASPRLPRPQGSGWRRGRWRRLATGSGSPAARAA